MMLNLTGHGELPMIDEDFDELGFDAFDIKPATDEEEAVLQYWIDKDVQRRIAEQERLAYKYAKHSAHVQASIDRLYITNGSK